MAKRGGYSVKQEIMLAFLELLTKKSYMDITVTDIVGEAKVARVSFYRNFNSISDVIDAVIGGLFAEFMADVMPALMSADERMWREFLLKYFRRFADIQKRIAAVSFQNMSFMLLRMDARIQQEGLVPKYGTPREKYLAFGKLGLVNNIAKKWMDEGMPETPEEMADYITSFIVSF